VKINIHLYGAMKSALPCEYAKSPICLYANSYRETLSLLGQYIPFRETLEAFPSEFRIGPSLKKSLPLSADQLATWNLEDETHLYIVPGITGNHITVAMLLTAVLSAAASIAISLLMNLLFPPPADTKDNRKSTLYQNGLNTQKEGIPLPIIAGKRVLCGFNVIEANVEVTNTGGTKTDTNAIIDSIHNKIGGNGRFALSEGNTIASTVISGSKGGGGNTIANTTFSDAVLHFNAAIGAGEIGGLIGSTPEEKEKSIQAEQDRAIRAPANLIIRVYHGLNATASLARV